MFAKLLKMEFRSTWNVLGILCLSLVGAGLLGGLAIRYLVGASAPSRTLGAVHPGGCASGLRASPCERNRRFFQ